MLRVVRDAASSVWAARRSVRKRGRGRDARDDVQGARRSVLTAFAGLGLQAGVWAVLLAELSWAVGLSAGGLGRALSLVAGVGVVALVLGGRVVERVGRRQMLALGGVGIGVAFLGLGVVDGITGVLVAFAVFGLAAGVLDLSANVVGGDYERQTGEREMTVFHAAFSAGAAVGALLSGAALAAGASFRVVYGSVGVALILLFGLLARQPLPTGVRGSAGDPARTAHLPPWRAGIARAAALVTVTFLIDAALEGFAAIYLRGTLAAGALLGGAGVAAFHLIGMLARLASAAVVRRAGERAVLVGAGLGGAVGLTLTAATTRPALAIGGLVVVGVSLAPVVPLAYSLAARSAPERLGGRSRR